MRLAVTLLVVLAYGMLQWSTALAHDPNAGSPISPAVGGGDVVVAQTDTDGDDDDDDRDDEDVPGPPATGVGGPNILMQTDATDDDDDNDDDDVPGPPATGSGGVSADSVGLASAGFAAAFLAFFATLLAGGYVLQRRL